MDGIGENSLGAIKNPGGPSGRLESFPVWGAFEFCGNSELSTVHQCRAATMSDRGFFLSLRALRQQLAAMPCGCYLIRLIHYHSRKPFPGERLWTAPQLLLEPTIRFLRARNREGFDIYFRPMRFTT